MSDDENLMTGGGRPSSPAPASTPENEDIISEILLRLPPAPSSLPRASLVCKSTDPSFVRSFRARHRRNAPLLGLFKEGMREIYFTPTLEPPDRIPSGRFSLHLNDGFRLLSSRHGLVLIHNWMRRQLLVWDPVTGDQRYVAYPPGPHFHIEDITAVLNGTVVRAAGDVNGGGHSSHFQVVLVDADEELTQTFACVYPSDTGTWGNLISTPSPSMFPVFYSSNLVGGSLCWFLVGDFSVGILEFDLDRQCLAVIEMPSGMSDWNGEFRVMRAEGGGLGFLLSVSIQHPVMEEEH